MEKGLNTVQSQSDSLSWPHLGIHFAFLSVMQLFNYLYRFAHFAWLSPTPISPDHSFCKNGRLTASMVSFWSGVPYFQIYSFYSSEATKKRIVFFVLKKY